MAFQCTSSSQLVNVQGCESAAALDAAHSDTRGSRARYAPKALANERPEVDERAPSITGEYFANLPPSLKILHCFLCWRLTDNAILSLKNISLEHLNVRSTNILKTSLQLYLNP